MPELVGGPLHGVFAATTCSTIENAALDTTGRYHVVTYRVADDGKAYFVRPGDHYRRKASELATSRSLLDRLFARGRIARYLALADHADTLGPTFAPRPRPET
jgi:hypothetical protein